MCGQNKTGVGQGVFDSNVMEEEEEQMMLVSCKKVRKRSKVSVQSFNQH